MFEYVAQLDVLFGLIFIPFFASVHAVSVPTFAWKANLYQSLQVRIVPSLVMLASGTTMLPEKAQGPGYLIGKRPIDGFPASAGLFPPCVGIVSPKYAAKSDRHGSPSNI